MHGLATLPEPWCANLCDPTLKLRKSRFDNATNGKERSDPGSGVSGPCFPPGLVAGQASVECEEDARRAQWAIGVSRWPLDGTGIAGDCDAEAGEPLAALMPNVLQP